MSITLFDEAILSDIPEVEDPITYEQYSNEGIAPTEIKDGVVMNGDAPKAGQVPPLIQYTLTPLKSGTGKMVTFYLNVTELTPVIVNQFILLSDILVQPTDVLFVHFNSIVEAPIAYVLNNAIRDCKAKAKIGCNPYVLNTAAVYPMLACDYIMPCKYGIMKFDACSIIAGGAGHKDAQNALAFDMSRKMNMLICARNAGFLPSDKYDYIADKQGSYAIFGKELYDAIMAFNRRKKEPVDRQVQDTTNPIQDANV